MNEFDVFFEKKKINKLSPPITLRDTMTFKSPVIFDFTKILLHTDLPYTFDTISKYWWRWYADLYGFFYHRVKRSYSLWLTTAFKKNIGVYMGFSLMMPDRSNRPLDRWKKRAYLYKNSFIKRFQHIQFYKFFRTLQLNNIKRIWWAEISNYISFPSNKYKRYLGTFGAFGHEVDMFFSSYNYKWNSLYNYQSFFSKTLKTTQDFLIVVSSFFLKSSLFITSFDSSLLLYPQYYLEYHNKLYNESIINLFSFFSIKFNIILYMNIIVFLIKIYFNLIKLKFYNYVSLFIQNKFEFILYKKNVYYYFLRYIKYVMNSRFFFVEDIFYYTKIFNLHSFFFLKNNNSLNNYYLFSNTILKNKVNLFFKSVLKNDVKVKFKNVILKKYSKIMHKMKIFKFATLKENLKKYYESTKNVWYLKLWLSICNNVYVKKHSWVDLLSIDCKLIKTGKYYNYVKNYIKKNSLLDLLSSKRKCIKKNSCADLLSRKHNCIKTDKDYNLKKKINLFKTYCQELIEKGLTIKWVKKTCKNIVYKTIIDHAKTIFSFQSYFFIRPSITLIKIRTKTVVKWLTSFNKIGLKLPEMIKIKNNFIVSNIFSNRVNSNKFSLILKKRAIFVKNIKFFLFKFFNIIVFNFKLNFGISYNLISFLKKKNDIEDLDNSFFFNIQYMIYKFLIFIKMTLNKNIYFNKFKGVLFLNKINIIENIFLSYSLTPKIFNFGKTKSSEFDYKYEKFKKLNFLNNEKKIKFKKSFNLLNKLSKYYLSKDKSFILKDQINIFNDYAKWK